MSEKNPTEKELNQMTDDQFLDHLETVKQLSKTSYYACNKRVSKMKENYLKGARLVMLKRNF